MKLKNLIILVTGCLLMLSSCADLEQKPQSFLTEEQYIQLPQDLDVVGKAVSGIYKDFWNNNYGFCCRMLRYNTAAGDVVPLVTKPNNTMLVFYNMNPGTATSFHDITSLWKNFWDVISSSNKVINGTPIPKNPQEAKKYRAVVAEARFTRALAYFYLVRIFGDVPFVRNQEEATKKDNPRVAVARVYDEIIIPDLKIAIQDLPSISRTGDAETPSKWAAQTCLADVYLTLGGWPVKRKGTYEQAANLSKDVILNSGLYLSPKYSDLWEEDKKHEANEHLFAIMNSVGYRTASQYGKSFYPKQHAKYPGWGDYFANPNFVNSSPDDDRKAWNFVLNWEEKISPKVVKMVNYKESANKLPLISKYRSYNSVNNNGQLSQLSNGLTPIYRLADTYLIYAEASNLANNTVDALALECIQKIQERAKVPMAERTTTMDPVAFDNAVFKERGIELYAEGKRWFDYIRREKANEIRDFRFEDGVFNISDPYSQSIYKREGHYYLPIPQNQVEMSGWQNNKGY